MKKKDIIYLTLFLIFLRPTNLDTFGQEKISSTIKTVVLENNLKVLNSVEKSQMPVILENKKNITALIVPVLSSSNIKPVLKERYKVMYRTRVKEIHDTVYVNCIESKDTPIYKFYSPDTVFIYKKGRSIKDFFNSIFKRKS